MREVASADCLVRERRLGLILLVTQLSELRYGELQLSPETQSQASIRFSEKHKEA